MNAGRQLLLVFACACCLLVVATALPSADPRVDSPDGSGWDPVVGSGTDTDPDNGTDTGLGDTDNGTDPGDSVEGNDSDDSVDVDDPGDGVDGNDSDDSTGVDDPGDNSSAGSIEIGDALVPGTEVDVRVQVDGQGNISTPVTVDGRPVGESATGYGEGASYEVPYSEERVTVSAPELNVTETFRVETDAVVDASVRRLPGRTFDLTAEVGGERVPGAAVDVEGAQVAETNDDGRATVEFPETATVVNVSVQRGVVTGERSLDSTDIELSMQSILLFPGLPTPVQVSADGEPVANATVVAGDNTVRTGENGRARVRLPVSDRATVTAAVGSEQATETVAGLYWRPVAVVTFVSVLVGLLATYRRFVSRATKRRHADVFYSIGKGLSNLFTPWASGRSDRRDTGGWLSWPSLSWPSLSWPSVSWPSPSWPSLSWPSLPSFGSAGPNLSWSVPSLGGSGDEDTSAGTTGEVDRGETPAGSGGVESDRSPEQQIGRGWHRFVEHLGVEQPETRTPGQVARRALAAGYPRRQVRALVETFRAVEYGGRELTRERVERVVETSRSLLEHREEES